MRERLLRVQSERLELPAPLGRRIAKTLHANAAGQATLNRGSDEIRREERERDGHVNLANAAFFAGGDLFKFGDFSSQRRPRAIALTKRARRSIRVGRTSFRETPFGTRICLDLLDGGFFHGTENV